MLCLVSPSCLTLCDPMDCNPPGSFVHRDFPGKNTVVGQVVLVVNNLPVNASDARDTDLILGLGRSPGVGKGNPLQYCCLKNTIDQSLEGYSSWGHKTLDSTEAAEHIKLLTCITSIIPQKNTTVLLVIVCPLCR